MTKEEALEYVSVGFWKDAQSTTSHETTNDSQTH